MFTPETQAQFNLDIPVDPETATLWVRKRDGRRAHFDEARIGLAIEGAFRDVRELGRDTPLPADVQLSVDCLAQAVAQRALGAAHEGQELEIELIQDLVETELMRSGQHDVARGFILFREERRKARILRVAAGEEAASQDDGPALSMTLPDGSVQPLDVAGIRRELIRACAGHEQICDWRELAEETLRSVYDGVKIPEVEKAMLFAAKARVERDPAYSFVTARLLLNTIYREVFDTRNVDQVRVGELHVERFEKSLRHGVEAGRLDAKLLEFDIARLAAALKPDRDRQFQYMGIQTVHDRYLLHTRGRRFETPQFFWMRVSMGLAMNEGEQKNDRAIEFYELLSSFRFCSSTPTLFNSGTLHPQLSSCYLSTVMDDLDHIFKVVADDAKLSKWAGGLGNDWTNVRATGSLIRGTNGESQGIVPFLKVANDTAVAVNQCFAPETPVHTAAGLKALRDVQPGDLVLGISGSYRPVTKHFTYVQKDRMVEIRAKHSAEPLRVTAGHPFYAIQGVPMEQSAERTLAQLGKGRHRAAWVDAGLLRRGDYLAQVIPQEIAFVPGLTTDDARLYGILLGDGHASADGYEWGVSGGPGEAHLAFVREYLRTRGIHFWETGRGETYAQVKWAAGKGLGRDAVNGRLVGLGGSHLPFSREDLYDLAGRKRIAPRLAHLPAGHTLELVRGLIETDGNVSRGKEITFTNSSRDLVEGLRYQLLRLGIPTAAQCRTRPTNRVLRRSDGSECALTKDCTSWDVRIPAVPELAALVGARPLTKRNWIVWENHLFTRIRSAGEIAVLPEVHDLEVETDHSYMTTSALVHNGGKRKGAMCAYLETWHLDIEDFLDLRKNTGDERRRTHDMNTANWIPDLFMKRVAAGAHWTLFTPSDVPDLHDLVGQAFEKRYAEYEAQAERGEIALSRRVEAVTLWRKMLTILFETGHPWITFKDPSNLRSPQTHAGVVHSSNLCCMTADQRVVTAEGLLTVGELFARCTPTMVVGRSGPVAAGPMLLPRPDAPIVKIHTREGYTHKVTPDHKVWVVDRGWVEAQELQAGDRLEIQQVEGLWGQDNREGLALLCGLVAGDGTFGRNEKTQQAHIYIWAGGFSLIPEIEETVARVLADDGEECQATSTLRPVFRGNEFRRRLTSTPLARVMLREGFRAETKFQVPEFVWRGTSGTVAQYLRGLYFADATTQAQELGVTTCALASRRLEFLREIQILLANFGIKSSISQMREAGMAMLPDGEGGEREYFQSALWRLLVTSIPGCRRLEEITGIGRLRGNARYLANLQKDGYRQKRWATFTALEPLPNEDAYCLQVFTEEHSWTVNGMITKNTEILLNTSADEVAVCNLGSVNLAAHISGGMLDLPQLEETVRTAMRMLDNVIDINYYPIPEAKNANLRHRPVGLGLMGFQDALYLIGAPYASEEAIEFADRSMEAISYYAILASTELAAERGRYASYPGSKWDQGLLPIDTLDILEKERGGDLDVDRSSALDWAPVRAAVAKHGMRNSNCMAIAPTATISNIIGVAQSIEPMYKNLFVKANLAGDFTVINEHLVNELKERGLWDAEMVNDLKYFDGELDGIERVPEDLKDLFSTAFLIDPSWLIECASRRQKWIDMGQSLNLYMNAPNGRKLNEMYLLAWRKGLKTTYYLRTLAATQIEKSTLDINRRGLQPRWMKHKSASANVRVDREANEKAPLAAEPTAAPALVEAAASPATDMSAVKACSLLDPTCEACQ